MPDLQALRHRTRRLFAAPWVVALCLAGIFALVLAFGHTALLVSAVVVPLLALWLVAPLDDARRGWATGDHIATRDTLLAYLEGLQSGTSGGHAGVILIELADLRSARVDLGPAGLLRVMSATGAALRTVVRDCDLVARYDAERIAVAFAPGRQATLETLVQMALRLQDRLRAPVQTPTGPLTVTVNMGICPPDTDIRRQPDALLAAAGAALARTRGHPPGTIRVACEGGDPMALTLARDLQGAFGRGEIVPFFQPQICTDTGALSGVEALARWQHRDHGTLSPGQFLPTIEAAGASRQLTETMMTRSLAQLAEWDRDGLNVPAVSINFTREDLADPDLPDRLAWWLDGAGIAPHRLGIEVLETVLSAPGETCVPDTLARLNAMGCRIDLDDFGTGQTSIAAIRRFSIQRLKIDRSFLRGIDSDRAQQDMVAAILTMADQLGLDTLAEGVETEAEHARAAELGCRHAQGYSIARPMEAGALPRWLEDRRARADRIAMPSALAQVRSAARRGRNGQGKTP